ncbi:MAG TPA: right-handed parallel beta-helix repeat-containing protein, partial [Thermoanaerobaculia bacterium]
MKSPLATLAFFLPTLVSASVGIWSSAPPLGAIVSRGALVKFVFEPYVSTVDEQNVIVDFDAAPARIESIAGGPLFQCTTSGTSARCTRDLFPKNTQTGIVLEVRMPSATAGGHIFVTATIRAASGSTATWRPDVVIPRTFVVTNTSSGDAGSFSDAITLANAQCTDTLPCEIDFQIPGPVPPSGFFTIAPTEPLPAITAKRLTIDAGEPNPDGPRIVLDGHGQDSPGITVTGSDVFAIKGFGIQNWGGAGILITLDQRRSVRATIEDNHLGPGNLRGIMSYGSSYMYVHDNVISGNRRSGVWIMSAYYPAVYENTIEENGASGIYFGPGSQFGAADENQIWSNGDFGVAVDPQSKWIEVRGNSMKDNGQLGIDYALDLVTPNMEDDSTRAVPNAPVVTSATYDPLTKTTVIIGHFDLRKPADVGYYGVIIDIYRSSALDAHGMAQGEAMLFGRLDYNNPVQLNRTTGDFVYTYNGDLTGQYITATATRMYALGKGGI